MKMKMFFVLAMLATASVASAQPTINYAGAAVQLGSNPGVQAVTRPVVSLNSTGSRVAVAYGEGNSIRIEIRNTTSPFAIVSSVVLATADTGFTGAGELEIAFTPDNNQLIVGWGVGASDGGAAFRRLDATAAPTLTTVGSVVSVESGFGNKPEFAFFSNGDLLVATEGADGALSGARLHKFNSSNTLVAGPVTVQNAGDVGADQNDPAVAIYNDTVLVAWEDAGNSRFTIAAPGTDDDVNYRFFDSSLVSLTPATSFFPVPAANLLTSGGPNERLKMGNPAVAYSDTGESLVIYEAEAPTSGSEQVWGNFFTAARTPVNATNSVFIQSGALSGRQQSLSAEYHVASGNFAVVWSARSASQVYLQFVSKTGTLVGTTTNVSDIANSNTRVAQFDLVGDTGVVSWINDVATDAGYIRIFTLGATGVENWSMY